MAVGVAGAGNARGAGRSEGLSGGPSEGPSDRLNEESRADDLSAILRFFKALADESRLKLVGLLAGGERSVDDLASTLGLKAPTVSHHLARLRDAGLAEMRQVGTTHLYRLDMEALRRVSRDVLTPERIRSLADDVQGDAWERKVLADFFEGERLKEIPASRKKRLVVLRWLAGHFRPGVRYAEREVNEILRRHHPDTATLRRELIADAHGLLQRDHGVYWIAGSVSPPEEPGASTEA